MEHKGGDWNNSWTRPGFLGSLTCLSLLSCNHLYFGSWTIPELVHLPGLNLPWKLGGYPQLDFLQGLMFFGLLEGPPCNNPTAWSDVNLGSWEEVKNKKRGVVLRFKDKAHLFCLCDELQPGT